MRISPAWEPKLCKAYESYELRLRIILQITQTAEKKKWREGLSGFHLVENQSLENKFKVDSEIITRNHLLDSWLWTQTVCYLHDRQHDFQSGICVHCISVQYLVTTGYVGRLTLCSLRQRQWSKLSSFLFSRVSSECLLSRRSTFIQCISAKTEWFMDWLNIRVYISVCYYYYCKNINE